MYGKPCDQNSVWFMILEKAVAKVVGGYHNIESISISKLLGIVLGCPIVSYGELTVERATKALQ